jgi:hypothetical protein
MMQRLAITASLLLLAVAWIAGPSAAQPTITQQDLDVSIPSPRISTEADLAQFNHALGALHAGMSTAPGSADLDAPARYWLRANARWWLNGGYWILGAPLVPAGPAVVVVGRPSQEVADLFAQTADEVARFMADHFNLPRPRYAFVVRLFSPRHDRTPMPRAMVTIFQQNADKDIQVAGVTLPPRFVILPTDLAPAQGADRPTVFVDKAGRISARGAFHDVVMHEFVHAHVHSLLVEGQERGAKPFIARDLPDWFDEGLAVYVTEKLMVEPGTATTEYYRFSAPLHYIEDRWGADVLSAFVNTAVLKNLDDALARIGVSDPDTLLSSARRGKPARAAGPPVSLDDFMKQAEEHANRPNVLAKLEGLGWFLGFLVLLVAAVLAPAAASWFYGTWLMQFPEVAQRRLRAAFADLEKTEGLDQRRAAAERFLALESKAPDSIAGEWTSQTSAVKQYVETYGAHPGEDQPPRHRRHRYGR